MTESGKQVCVDTPTPTPSDSTTLRTSHGVFFILFLGFFGCYFVLHCLLIYLEMKYTVSMNIQVSVGSFFISVNRPFTFMMYTCTSKRQESIKSKHRMFMYKKYFNDVRVCFEVSISIISQIIEQFRSTKELDERQ